VRKRNGSNKKTSNFNNCSIFEKGSEFSIKNKEKMTEKQKLAKNQKKRRQNQSCMVLEPSETKKDHGTR
jgi:hypothetical protein